MTSEPPLDARSILSRASAVDVLSEAARAGILTPVTLLDTLPWFRGAADWTPWRAFLCAAFALPMSEAELAIFRRFTGRQDPPKRQVGEAYAICGRRARKTAIGALLGVYLGALGDHEAYLAPGERALIPLISRDKRDARQLRDFAAAILDCPPLRGFQRRPPLEESIDLLRCDLEIRAIGPTAGRGKTIPAALLDECAFWRNDDRAALPDREFVDSIRPAMMRAARRLILVMSSPHTRRGIVWSAYHDHYGEESDDVLVWRADTVAMHDAPDVRAFVASEYLRDPQEAAGEYGAEFRSDVEQPLDADLVAAVTDAGRAESPPMDGVTYFAFADPSGGAHTSFAVGIAHYDPALGGPVVDVAREWPAPYDPEEVVPEACDLLRQFGLRWVTGDRYAGEWPRSRFRAGCHDRGTSAAAGCARWSRPGAPCTCPDGPWSVEYRVSHLDKSALIRAYVPMIRGCRTRLPDVPRLGAQLANIERHATRLGQETYCAPRGGLDDLANVAAGAAALADEAKLPVRTVRPKPTNNVEAYHAALHDELRRQIRGMRPTGPPSTGGSFLR